MTAAKFNLRNLHPQVRDALEECGLPWHVEVGRRHWKLYIADAFMGILPFNNANHDRTHINMRANIRRKAKELKEGVQ